jgi:hypothetical protein
MKLQTQQALTGMNGASNCASSPNKAVSSLRFATAVQRLPHFGQGLA